MDINDLREKINEIDPKLTELFIDRMKVSAKIADYKLQNGMNIRDEKREQEIIDSLSAGTDSIYAPYIKALYSQIFEMSRRYQSHLQIVSSIEYGLIGVNVSNSYAKWIHHGIGNKNFGLYSLPPEMIPMLFEKRAFKGLSISAPYKDSVAAYCDRLDTVSKSTGYVNTIVKEADGTLTGYNTEYAGFLTAAEDAGLDFKNKKVMIFGDGSMSYSMLEALKDNGAADIYIVTRTGHINYRNYAEYNDAEIILNASEIGMDPNSSLSPADLSVFPNLSGVADCVYTPIETAFITAARKRGVPCVDGLSIMIERSISSSALFGFMPDEKVRDELYDELLSFVD